MPKAGSPRQARKSQSPRTRDDLVCLQWGQFLAELVVGYSEGEKAWGMPGSHGSPPVRASGGCSLRLRSRAGPLSPRL